MSGEKVPPWWQRHRLLLAILAGGYVLALIGLRLAGRGSEWVNATSAYFLVANLLVLWWYSDTTHQLLQASQKQVSVSKRQFGVAWRTHREGNKPFVVVDLVEDSNGGYSYFLRNIGPGIAVNVWLVRMRDDGTVSWQTLGPLAPQSSKRLSGNFQRNLCDSDGLITFALYSEALITRTAQWNATVNAKVRGLGGEMRSMALHIEPRDEQRTIEQVLGPMHGDEWHRLSRALHDIGAGI